MENNSFTLNEIIFLIRHSQASESQADDCKILKKNTIWFKIVKVGIYANFNSNTVISDKGAF